MWILPVTFALSLGFVLGVYWLFVMRPERESRAHARAYPAQGVQPHARL